MWSILCHEQTRHETHERRANIEGKHATRRTHLKNSLEGRRLVVREWWRRVGVWHACEADLPRENALDERRLCLRLMHEGHRLG